MSKITVLVAVYNTEKYLKTCLDSLVNQTLKDIQIVCIDDCSTDGSLQILKEYASADPRFVILQQPQNMGQAKARNRGLTVANGEFITMLDSDDWFEPNALALAYADANLEPNIDVAIFRLMLYKEDTGIITQYTNKTFKKIMTGENAFLLSLKNELPGLYIIRAELHKQYPYDDSCLLYSDDNTTRIHYLHARNVAISNGVYFYRQHSNSMTTACSIRKFDFMDANLSMKNQLLQEAAAGNIHNAKHVLHTYENMRWLGIIDAYAFFYRNKSHFTNKEQIEIHKHISKMLKTIDTKMIRPSLKYKFGYYPFKSYRLFKRFETIYLKLQDIKKPRLTK